MGCFLDLSGNGFTPYSISIKPNIILLNEDVVYEGLSYLDIQVTIQHRDEDGLYGYTYSDYGTTNSAGVYLVSKAWEFEIGSELDEILITVYEENGTLIGSCHKSYYEFKNISYWEPDCLLYH